MSEISSALKRRREYAEKNQEKLRKQKQDWYYRTAEIRKEVGKQYRIKNPDQIKGMALKNFWPNLSALDRIKEYNRLLHKQNYLCAICIQPERITYKKENKKIRDLQVDHCHKTGKIRGLLCHSCNIAIGKLLDNPEYCINAANYLRNTNE